MKKYVLFDRDGVLVRDPEDYRIKSIDEIDLFDDSISALKTLHDNGFSAIIVTNQAGISEGVLSESDYDEVHGAIVRQLEESGIEIVTTYMCPHTAEDECLCRKPEPKMLQQAIEDYELNSENLFMVGDHSSDIEAGKAAGVQTILVHTATGPYEESPGADYEADDLTEAVNIIIENS
jgi:D-glycero-D-manno-heptose 1,7-bisphosphate phosphatase